MIWALGVASVWGSVSVRAGIRLRFVLWRVTHRHSPLHRRWCRGTYGSREKRSKCDIGQ